MEMDFYLCIHSISTFDEIIEKGVTIEKALAAKSLVKIYNENNDKPSNDKSTFQIRIRIFSIMV